MRSPLGTGEPARTLHIASRFMEYIIPREHLLQMDGPPLNSAAAFHSDESPRRCLKTINLDLPFSWVNPFRGRRTSTTLGVPSPRAYFPRRESSAVFCKRVLFFFFFKDKLLRLDLSIPLKLSFFFSSFYFKREEKVARSVVFSPSSDA